jgi:hypothetical protein
MEYIIASKIMANNNLNKLNCVKIESFYPGEKARDAYTAVGDYKKFQKDFWRELPFADEMIASTIITPVLKKNHNIMLICMAEEDDYIRAFTEYVFKKFRMRCIDLNHLFKTGETDIFFINRDDRDEIHDATVETNRRIVRNLRAKEEETKEGRLLLVHAMSREERKDKIEDLGFNVKGMSDGDMINVLIDEYVERAPDSDEED